MSDGYGTEVPYIRTFTRQMAPAWLDHAALVCGFSPPGKGSGFAWCDLGCAHGFTAAVMAAAHPGGSFYGIDANAAHIASAKWFACDAGVANISFHTADFDQATDFDLPAFDYVVSQGVYSWVGERARESWRRFVARHLKPGGLVYVSYNAMPGRAADLPLQRLVRSLGAALPGDGLERARGAVQIALSMTEAKVPALVASPMAAFFKERGNRLSPGYVAHELMVANWEPLCVTDVRAAMASIGLRPLGSANLMENYDSFVLGQAARETLRTIEDPDVRELVRDFFIDQFFRCDVFIREGRRIGENERRAGLLESTWSLARPSAMIEYHVKTPAGRLNFDNRASRHIVAALAAGPRRLREMADDSIPAKDLVANALVLSAADAIWPVEPNCGAVARLNAAIFQRAGGEEEINYVALPFGTAVPASRELLTRLRDGGSFEDDPFGGWVASRLARLR